MVSLKDIAKACGVSAATVSKALNGQLDVSEKTRLKIKEAAARLGYMPNASARALKTKHTCNLGILFADDRNSGLTHDYFSAIIESFKKTAEKKGYDITFLNTSLPERSYYEHCRYRGLDGVVIACIDFDQPDVQELIKSDLPVVTIDRIFDGKPAVVSDNVGGMTALMEYICSCGHRKIAYIHGHDSSSTRNRLIGYHRVLEKYGIKVREEFLLETGYRDAEETGKMTGKLLELQDPPTCIIFPDDFASIGGINEIRRRGLQIPGDVSTAGYDGSVISRVLSPKLASLRQDVDTIGKRSAELLIDLIERPKVTGTEIVYVSGSLQEGESVKHLAVDQAD